MESLTKTKQPEVKNFIGGEFVRSVQPSDGSRKPINCGNNIYITNVIQKGFR